MDMDEAAAKRLAFYEASANAWLQTAMELDRSLLTLSVAGLGLLVTLLTTQSGSNPTWVVTLYVISIGGFSVCTLAVLAVFQQNKAVVLEILQSQDASRGGAAQKTAGRLDWVVRIAFIVGALALAAVAITLAVKSHGGRSVNEKRPPGVVISTENFGGVFDLSRVSKSLNGFADFAPPPADKPAGSSSQEQSSTTGDGGGSSANQGGNTAGQSEKPK